MTDVRTPLPGSADGDGRDGTARTRGPGPLHVRGAGAVWPIAAICLGMPIWFFLGAAAFVWSVPGLVLTMDLLRRRRVVLPPGTGLLAALLGWIVLSGVQVRGVQSLVLYGYRLSIFLSLAAIYVWLSNASERSVPSHLVIRLLGGLWVVLILFGYAALALPDVDVASPLQRLLPGPLGADEYVGDLTSIRFAETQGFLGYEVPRPSAPMAFANGWGSTLGILTPLFVLAWVVEAPPRWRRTGRVLFLLGLVPAVVSLNRGLWLSVAVALSYVCIRSLVAGDRRTVVRVLAAAVAVGVVVAVTPLAGLITDKVGGATDGDETRSSAYAEAMEETLRSPLLGHGAPVTKPDVPVAVGTHGLIWYLMVSHGLPALALFLLWLAGVLRRGIALGSARGTWLTAAAVVCAFQVPIYGLLPQVVLAGAIAALIGREQRASRADA